ncbi:MAG: beta-ketoacyl-ACP synthase III [Candidatus Gastranaerophilaceae bacterium]|jgi:3-oxoacyl-[acyl-carrier-protein] synthase-3
MTESKKICPVSVIGVGKGLPEKVITNEDLSAILDTNDEWISSRTGIKERRVLSGNETATSISLKAAENAIKNAKIDKEKIDLIIVATSMPDNLYPSVACEVQGLLGLSGHIPAFDVTAACTGSIYAISIARSFIMSGLYETVLVIGVDVHSRFVDWTDRSTCVLFGDGAGAFVIQKSKDGKNRIHSVEINADGAKGGSDLKIPLNGKNCPLVEPNDKREQFVYMNGKEVYKFAITIVPESVTKTLEKAGMTIKNLDYFIPHQANIRIVKAIQERLGLEDSQIFSNMNKYGNTSAASIPIAVTEALESGAVKLPCTVAISGFGAGLTWGTAIITLE